MIMANPTAREAAEAAAWAESDAPTIRPDARPQRGNDRTREDAHAMLAAAAEGDPESTALLDRARGGRPSLDNTPGPSTKWNLRVPADLAAAATQRAEREGRPLSAVVRDAVTDYLNRAS